MTASNTTFTVFSGVSFFLSVIPLWWHLRSWNTHVGTCMFMIWTALACIVHFVDSIVWNGNTVNWAPVWCDIAVRIIVGVSAALPACTLCITRSLYNITVKTTPLESRRETAIGLLITVGIPLLEMVLQYIVAGHRFDIFEDYGCAVVTYNTPLAYVLFWSWPLIISVVSACYGALATRAFFRRRKQLKDLDADFDYSNYWRLIAIASVDFLFVIPLSSWDIALGVLVGGVRPWISWGDTHWGYSRVDQYPKVSMDPLQILSLELDRWSIVFTAFTFFGFFGFAEEARKNYRLLASTLAKPLGYAVFTEGKTSSSPVINTSLHFASHALATRQTESKSDSDSFLDKPPISTATNECEVKLQPCYSMDQSAPFGSLSPHIDVVPRIPERVLELPLARRSGPDATDAVHPDGALRDQV